MHEITRDDRVGEISSFPQRICDVMTPWSEDSPDRPALVEGSGAWTYRAASVRGF